MSNFRFSKRSLKNLEGVHPDMVKLMKRTLASSDIDFMIICGLRTKEQQQVLYDTGKSQTLNSRHLTGHAVDIAVWIDGGISWDPKYYKEIGRTALEQAALCNIHTVWGGNWKHFKDYGHFELDRHYYFEDEPYKPLTNA